MSERALWYRDAVIYQLRIRSFCDSNDDGIGDIPGLTSRLDYLKDLGATAVWLLPFYPSPLRDDGYDIADYTDVHPDVGTLNDFRRFLREAHRRGLHVITELVMNHTSDQHPWFQRARRSPPGSREREYYVWSDDTTRYEEARIIFKDFETSNWTWDPVAKSHYWHRFYSHQPDLNFDNPAVRKEMFRALDFWFDMGVDGVRLDAIPYLYERDGTSCENLPETHAFLKELRAHMDANFEDRMLLAEANQWPEDAVQYFGSGDECHMAFHFPIMPRLFMALHMETRDPILDILEQTPAIPDTCQWSIFLRNHDELTLEMVTDEERDYMWRAYAPEVRARINLGIRHRLAPLLRNDRRRIELMNALLFSMPGTPIIYYGDEIGMGDNIYLGDRDAVRTPMQWSPDRNAGFSRSNPQRLVLPIVSDPQYSPDTVNVEVQERNLSSLLWFTKRILALRRRHPAFGRGTFEPLHPANRSVLAFLRRYENQCLLVVVNLSRFPQYAELDLRELAGRTPEELFGRRPFPKIGELPYLVTLGPHGFYWFEIRDTDAVQPVVEIDGRPQPATALAEIQVEGEWRDIGSGAAQRQLGRALVDYLPAQRWYRSKARTIREVTVSDAIPVGEALLVLAHVVFEEGDPEDYALPLIFHLGEGEPQHAVARLCVRGSEATVEGYVTDGAGDPALGIELLDIVQRRRRRRGRHHRLEGFPALAMRHQDRWRDLPPPALLDVEQSNTSWHYGDQLVGKLYRRLENGQSPELVLGRHLSDKAHFQNVPALAGHLGLRRESGGEATLAIFQAWVPNEGSAWDLAQRQLEALLDLAAERGDGAATPEIDERVAMAGDLARLLGQRTGEMHAALRQPYDDPAMESESFTPFARRSYAQAVRNLAVRNLDLLEARLESLPGEAARQLAAQVLARRDDIERRARDIADVGDGGRLIRCHGDYHLGQVLYTGSDFVIIDFEGEPGRSLADRQRKRSPLTDVAGMQRSLHYAMEYALRRADGEASGRRGELEAWARSWYDASRRAFLDSYFAACGAAADLLPDAATAARMLDVLVLEKALYEVGYELNNRPDWIEIPLRGLCELLGDARAGAGAPS